MIANYPLPQVTIAQIFEQAANPLLDRIHAVVVGPAYTFSSSAADNLVWSDYEASAELTYRYENGEGVETTLAGDHTVEQDGVKLNVRDLRLELWTKGTATDTPSATQFRTYEQDPTGDLLQYTAAAGFYDTADVAVAEAFDSGRPPQVGDLFRITTNLGTLERKVAGIVGKDVDAVVSLSTGYQGAVTWDDSSASSTLELATANFSTTAVALEDAGTTEPILFARRKGTTPSTGGLRLAVEITCSASGDRDTADFTATANGTSIPVANAAGGVAGNTVFTVLTDFDLSITKAAASNVWTAGDRFTVYLDFANPGNLGADLAAEVDVTNYIYANAASRLNSALVVEVLEVTDATNILVRISDTNGLATVQTVSTAGAVPVEVEYDGVTIEMGFDTINADAHVGQIYTIPITPPTRSTTVFDKVRLAGPVSSSGAQVGVAVTAYKLHTGVILAEEPVLGGTNFTPSATLVTLDSIKAAVAGYTDEADSVKTAASGYGEVSVAWRALQPVGTTESVFPVDSTDDIVTKLGSSALDSELGLGCRLALNGAQGKRVYGLRVGGLDTTAFAAALRKLESVKNIYAIVPLSDDEEVVKLFSEHAARLSAKDVKRFRCVYAATDSPGTYPILKEREDSTTYSATITAGVGGENTLVEFVDLDLDLEALVISPGDTILLPGTGVEYPIDRVTGVRELVLSEGPDLPISVATVVQIIAADTPENTGRYVYSRSERYGANTEQDRRTTNVWTDDGVYDVQDGSPTTIPNRFLACEVAGLRTVLQPQQSLTRTEIESITDAPSMYTRFDRSVLDDMAARGVFIVTQNGPDEPVYVRHQITTAVADNNPLYYEDSVRINVDSICFAIDDIVDPLIGKRNATQRTVAEIKNLVIDLLADLTQEDIDSVIGPQLVDFQDRDGNSGTLNVEIDPNAADRIKVYVKLIIPLPLNNVEVVVESATVNQAGTTVNILTATFGAVAA
jgi:hypothetical protein